MRRRAGIFAIVALVASAAAGISVLGGGAQAGSTYRVDAIFDTAKGIIPGQLVKVAGARVGKIKDVTLTRVGGSYKARIQMEVDRRFAPFHSDARCDIQPEGLISENFVQCTPGTPAGHKLLPSGGNAPTVPVSNTSATVNLSDLFQIWQAPVRYRLTVALNALGAGGAGRGEDFNELLRRANPTLALVRRTLATLNSQRTEIQTIISSADRVTAELAKRSRGVSGFIEHAAHVTKQTGDHSGALAQAVRRLPALLDATDPALRRLDEVSASATPVLGDLRASASSLSQLVSKLDPFAAAAKPALRRLAAATTPGRRAARSAAPVVRNLRRVAQLGRPAGQLANDLFVSLRDRGAIEGLLGFAYYATAASARYDRISHIIPARVVLSGCTPFAVVPVPGCSANYSAPALTATAPTSAPATRTAPGPQGASPAAGAPATPGAAQPSANPLQGLLDRATGATDETRQVLQRLLDYLLK